MRAIGSRCKRAEARLAEVWTFSESGGGGTGLGGDGMGRVNEAAAIKSNAFVVVDDAREPMLVVRDYDARSKAVEFTQRS